MTRCWPGARLPDRDPHGSAPINSAPQVTGQPPGPPVPAPPCPPCSTRHRMVSVRPASHQVLPQLGNCPQRPEENADFEPASLPVPSCSLLWPPGPGSASSQPRAALLGCFTLLCPLGISGHPSRTPHGLQQAACPPCPLFLEAPLVLWDFMQWVHLFHLCLTHGGCFPRTGPRAFLSTVFQAGHTGEVCQH